RLLPLPQRGSGSPLPSLTLFLENSFREFLAGEEAYALFCGDFDGFAVAWIDPLASSALADLERAKTNQAYFVATLESLANGFQGNFQHLSGLLLGDLCLLSDAA